MTTSIDDDAADRLSRAERVSIRAVLTPDGQNPVSTLLENGIMEPVALPFLFDDGNPGTAAAMGDGRTPSLPATLEMDQGDTSQWDEDLPEPPFARPDGRMLSADNPAARTTTLPAAYGMKPMAPVRKFPI